MRPRGQLAPGPGPSSPIAHNYSRGTQPTLDLCQQGNKREVVQTLPAPILQGSAPLGKHRSLGGCLYKSWFPLTP